MRNRKGFTLVEVLVSIGLLALIGTVIGISLNKAFKDNNKNNYDEFVEKVKSAAMLYVNNTVDIINDLNDNSFKVITIGDLINNGYLNDNLVNPSTNEKVGKNEEIQVSYDSDYELIVVYPYTNDNKESYLYTLNYSVMYGDTTEDLCYVGLNTRSLQLINHDGTPVKDYNSNKILVSGQNIKAYMENGEECTNLNLSSDKIGTYKIIYEYTKNYNEKLNQANVDKKSAERTITVKPSKPVISTFSVKPQKNETDVNYNVYDAKMDLSVTDIKGVKLKYCIVGVKSDDTTSLNNLMMKCSDEVKTVSGVNQLNNTWVDLTNGTMSNNKETYVISKNFNIEKEMADYINYSEIKFYVFVKNSFEEYSSKLNVYNNGVYLMRSMILFHLQSNDAYFNGIKKETNNIYMIKNIANNTPFNEIMNSNANYKRVYRTQYYFKGWSATANGTTVQYTNSTTTEILGTLNLYAVWEKDNILPTCLLKITNGKIVADVYDNFELFYYGWDSSYNGSNLLEKELVLGNSSYYVKDYAENTNICKIDVKEKEEKTKTSLEPCQRNYLVSAGTPWSWYCDETKCPGAPGWYVTKTIQNCEYKTRTYFECPSGYIEDTFSGKCYKN